MENIFGGLIEFKHKEDFDLFIDNLTDEDAINIIEMSSLYGQQNGLYSLEESHAIYKCIRKLKENGNKNQGNNIPNDDSDGDID